MLSARVSAQSRSAAGMEEEEGGRRLDQRHGVAESLWSSFPVVGGRWLTGRRGGALVVVNGSRDGLG